MNNNISDQVRLTALCFRVLRISLLFAAAWAGNCASLVCAQALDQREPTLKELIAQLNHDNLDQRLAAVDDIAWCDLYTGETKNAIEVLQKLLGDSSAAMRIAAASALWEMDQPASMTLQVVVQELDNIDPDIRKDAAWLIGSFGRHASSAIDEVVELSTDDDSEIRRIAARILGKFGPDHKLVSVPLLTSLLNDPEPEVRLSAATALAAVNGPLDLAVDAFRKLLKEEIQGEFLSFEIVGAIGELEIDGAAAIPEIIESIEMGSVLRQVECLVALGKMGPQAKPALGVLAIALRDGETHGYPFVHRTFCRSDDASNALAKIGIDAVPVLLAALDDPDKRVRANAANALGDIPEASAQAIPALIKLLDDPEATVRAIAAWALGKIGHAAESATSQLVPILFDDSEWSSAPAGGGIASQFSLPWHAVEAIARIQPNNELLVSAFDSALNDASGVNFAVATTIASMKADAKPLIPKLARFLNESASRSAAAFAIASIDPDQPGLQAALEESLIAGDGEIDRVAVRGLELLGKRAADSIPKLETVIRTADDSEFVGDCSDMILASISILKIDISNTHASDILLQALFDSHRHFDDTAIAEAIAAMPDFATRQEYLRNRLIEQLDFQMVDSDERRTEAAITVQCLEFRLQAATVLTVARIATPETLEALRLLLLEGKYRRRGIAADLLGSYGQVAKGQVDALAQHLADDKTYTLGGDVYGNGGTDHIVAEHVAQALAAIGSDSVPVLIEKLNDPWHIVRANAAQSLGLIGANAGGAIDDLILKTKDPSHLVRREAVIALGKIASPEPVINKTICEALLNASNDQRPSVSTAATEALGSVEHQQ